MTTIIDGNNLLHKIPHFKKLFSKDKEAAQIALVETIMPHKNKNEKIIFLFDGFGKIKRPDVIFSNEITADEMIRKRIENFKNPKLLKVVSSDYEIINLAKACGCEVQKSEDFWNELNRAISPTEGKNINQNYIYDKLEKPERMSKREIDEFRKYFS